MIFNENFAIGEQYVTNSGEMFRVVDVENTSDTWFSSGNLRARPSTAQRLPLKRVERLSFALDIFWGLYIS